MRAVANTKTNLIHFKFFSRLYLFRLLTRTDLYVLNKRSTSLLVTIVYLYEAYLYKIRDMIFRGNQDQEFDRLKHYPYLGIYT